jgi:hypothetical protein
VSGATLAEKMEGHYEALYKDEQEAGKIVRSQRDEVAEAAHVYLRERDEARAEVARLTALVSSLRASTGASEVERAAREVLDCRDAFMRASTRPDSHTSVALDLACDALRAALGPAAHPREASERVSGALAKAERAYLDALRTFKARGLPMGGDDDVGAAFDALDAMWNDEPPPTEQSETSLAEAASEFVIACDRRDDAADTARLARIAGTPEEERQRAASRHGAACQTYHEAHATLVAALQPSALAAGRGDAVEAGRAERAIRAGIAVPEYTRLAAPATDPDEVAWNAAAVLFDEVREALPPFLRTPAPDEEDAAVTIIARRLASPPAAPPLAESTRAQVPDAERLAGIVTPAEAREIAARYHTSHWTPRTRHGARYSIPADPRRDDDIRLAAFIDQAERALYASFGPPPSPPAMLVAEAVRDEMVERETTVHEPGGGTYTSYPGLDLAALVARVAGEKS